MKKNKNILALALMVSSVVLLIVLQFLWLRSSYKQAFYDFRREANVLFRTTVLDLRDSLLVLNIRPLSEDSIAVKQSQVIAYALDTLIKRPSSTDRIAVKKSSSEVQIFVTKGDSVTTHDVIGPITSQIRNLNVKESGGAKSFMIRLTDDSLDLNVLNAEYLKAIKSTEVDIPFVIRHRNHHEPMEPLPGLPPMRMRFSQPDLEKEHVLFGDSLYTEPVRINPAHQYEAAFHDVKQALLKNIAPQILFSLFLTLMISGAFLIMYKNMRAQQKLMELKNDFISNVTHELKTPVATVSVALEAIKNFQAGNNPKLSEEYLDIAQNEINRLSLMMDKILRASIFESKGVTYTPEKVNLKSIIDQVLGSLKVVFEKREVQVNFTAEGNDFIIHKGSSMHLTNVVYNLIDNAVKYSPEKPTISISLKSLDNELTLGIKDLGIGIPKEYKKRIFEKFFRVPTGDIHTIKGYGLGLNYVERVVESHRGKITVESEPGMGSTFQVTIPKS